MFLVVVHCPIGLIPLLGCVGSAGCQLNFPYVWFLYVKILWTTLGRQRGKERERNMQERSRVEFWICVIKTEHSCEPSKLLLCHSFSGALTSPFLSLGPCYWKSTAPLQLRSKPWRGQHCISMENGHSCSCLGHTAACLTCNFS